MSAGARIVLCVVIALSVALGTRQAAYAPQRGLRGLGSDGGAQFRLDPTSARRAHVPLLSARVRAGSLAFATDARADQRRFFLAAVAAARPAARRLIALVDGLVTVHFADPGAGRIGLTHFDGRDYDVTVDLDRILAGYGAREATAVVLHELGHVVDIALVPDVLARRLDAGIPRGASCSGDGPPLGACAPIDERFAESFSKWAMDDLGVSLASGYHVLPPVPLDAWGAPLVGLAALSKEGPAGKFA